MQSADEENQTCSCCKERQATETYARATPAETISDRVCATCLDRREVQEAFECICRDVIIPLEISGQYDEALARLDRFFEANRHRDHDNWLARSIARDRAMILSSACRYAEAERACEAWAGLGFADVGERWMHGSVAAETMDELGRSTEGLAVLEDALSYRDPSYVPGAWGHLETLAEISERLGVPVNPKWRNLAQASGEWYGVEMPKQESLAKAILALAEAIRNAPEGTDLPGEGRESR